MAYTIHVDEEYEQYIRSLAIDKCPRCGGPADNGFDRCYPPNPYNCSKCEKSQVK